MCYATLSCPPDVEKLVTESRKVLKEIAGIETDKVHFYRGILSPSLSVLFTPAGGEDKSIREISSL